MRAESSKTGVFLLNSKGHSLPRVESMERISRTY